MLTMSYIVVPIDEKIPTHGHTKPAMLSSVFATEAPGLVVPAIMAGSVDFERLDVPTITAGSVDIEQKVSKTITKS